MASIFYRELGFSLGEIAAVAKVYGLSANFVGIAVGGVLVARLGLYRALFAGAWPPQPPTSATPPLLTWVRPACPSPSP